MGDVGRVWRSTGGSKQERRQMLDRQLAILGDGVDVSFPKLG